MSSGDLMSAPRTVRRDTVGFPVESDRKLRIKLCRFGDGVWAFWENELRVRRNLRCSSRERLRVLFRSALYTA